MNNPRLCKIWNYQVCFDGDTLLGYFLEWLYITLGCCWQFGENFSSCVAEHGLCNQHLLYSKSVPDITRPIRNCILPTSLLWSGEERLGRLAGSSHKLCHTQRLSTHFTGNNLTVAEKYVAACLISPRTSESLFICETFQEFLFPSLFAFYKNTISIFRYITETFWLF